ncbi:MAG TPA: ATP-binding cassette domain-containing protein, partial [Gudongella oleilytica]|nr:ATP-binding cassette domain-containing protein [Gudongella oleilytica]
MISVRGLTKKYGDVLALNNVNMYVNKGEIYGFIGHNGAGKSTAMGILAGLSNPDDGECVVNGMNVRDVKHPGDLRIGYLPEEPRFYPWMS